MTTRQKAACGAREQRRYPAPKHNEMFCRASKRALVPVPLTVIIGKHNRARSYGAKLTKFRDLSAPFAAVVARCAGCGGRDRAGRRCHYHSGVEALHAGLANRRPRRNKIVALRSFSFLEEVFYVAVDEPWRFRFHARGVRIAVAAAAV